MKNEIKHENGKVKWWRNGRSICPVRAGFDEGSEVAADGTFDGKAKVEKHPIAAFSRVSPLISEKRDGLVPGPARSSDARAGGYAHFLAEERNKKNFKRQLT